MYLATMGGRILAASLFEIGAVKFVKADEPGWRLKLHETRPDAPLSPLYFNLRTPDNPKPGPLDGQKLAMIAKGFQWLIDERNIGCDAVCGIPNAGVPIVDPLAARVGSKTIELVKIGDDATGRRISGLRGWAHLSLGDSVLLIDDVITGADTKIEAVEAICATGLVVNDLLVVVDREQGGVAELNRHHHVRVHSLFGVRSLLIFYLAQDLIDMATYDRVIGYLQGEEAACNPSTHT